MSPALPVRSSAESDSAGCCGTTIGRLRRATTNDTLNRRSPIPVWIHVLVGLPSPRAGAEVFWLGRESAPLILRSHNPKRLKGSFSYFARTPSLAVGFLCTVVSIPPPAARTHPNPRTRPGGTLLARAGRDSPRRTGPPRPQNPRDPPPARLTSLHECSPEHISPATGLPALSPTPLSSLAPAARLTPHPRPPPPAPAAAARAPRTGPGRRSPGCAPGSCRSPPAPRSR